MTTKDLLTFALTRLMNKGNASVNDVVSFIETLLNDPQTELTNIKIDMSAEFQKRQQGQVAYKAKLDADVLTLQALDVSTLIKPNI